MKPCIDAKQAGRYTAVFKALGHPVRLQIVAGLIDRECNVKRITACLGIPQATVSQQLAVLRGAGLLTCERKGNQVCYRVRKPWLRRLVRLIARNTEEV